jgi:hypothetical protein
MTRESDHDFEGLGRVIAVRGESKIFHRFSHAALVRGGDLVPDAPARDLALELREGLQKPGASPSGASHASAIELCTRSQLKGGQVVNAVTRPGRSAGVGNRDPARRLQKTSTTPGWTAAPSRGSRSAGPRSRSNSPMSSISKAGNRTLTRWTPPSPTRRREIRPMWVKSRAGPLDGPLNLLAERIKATRLPRTRCVG